MTTLLKRPLRLHFALDHSSQDKKSLKTDVFSGSRSVFSAILTSNPDQILQRLDKFLRSSRLDIADFNAITIAVKGAKDSLFHRQLETVCQTVLFLNNPFRKSNK